jgi:hypothetical protein
MSEYSIPVQAWYKGTTAGVSAQVSALFDTQAQGQLTEETQSLLNKTLGVFQRVVLSTDADLDFFILRAYEGEKGGEELILTYNLGDLKRVYAYQISRGDYQTRSLVERGYHPVVIGEQAVRALINDLEGGEAVTILNTYFTKILGSTPAPERFLTLLQLGTKQNRKFELLEMKSIRIDRSIALILTKVRETYDLAPGFEQGQILFPSGYEHEWLFEVISLPNPQSIRNVVVLSSPDASGATVQSIFPDHYADWKDTALWDGSPFEEVVKWDQFISAQSGNRIHLALREEEELSQLFEVYNVRCLLVSDGETPSSELSPDQLFYVQVSGSWKKPSDGSKDDPVFRKVLEIASKSLTNYGYEDYIGYKIEVAGEFDSYLVLREEASALLSK